MDDGSTQVGRALIGDVEYRFVEGLLSATGDGEVVVCEAAEAERGYATREAWEAGRARFEASRLAGEGVVTSASSSAEKLALFNSLFVMRSDVYAKSYFNKKTSRVGYTPACANEWVRDVCGKPRVKCADCANREFLPLDDVALLAHFKGSGREGVGIAAGYRRWRAGWMCRRSCPIPRTQSRRRCRQSPMPPPRSSRVRSKCRSAKPDPTS